MTAGVAGALCATGSVKRKYSCSAIGRLLDAHRLLKLYSAVQNASCQFREADDYAVDEKAYAIAQNALKPADGCSVPEKRIALNSIIRDIDEFLPEPNFGTIVALNPILDDNPLRIIFALVFLHENGDALRKYDDGQVVSKESRILCALTQIIWAHRRIFNTHGDDSEKSVRISTFLLETVSKEIEALTDRIVAICCGSDCPDSEIAAITDRYDTRWGEIWEDYERAAKTAFQ